MTLYQWATLVLGALGFLGTWLLGAFLLGRAVEQMRAALKEYIDSERDKTILKIDELESKIHDDQKTQDHNFGEVGAALRQYIADVEKKMREIEIYGRDNYVRKPELDAVRADIKSLGADIKSLVGEIKIDLKEDIKEIKTKLNEH